MPTPTTRLAPSPTGALHLGNARTFLINWAIARQQNHHILMRIEDLDSPRVKADAADQALEDLRWLGVDWDSPVFYQRADLAPYAAALDQLRAASLVYPCSCSRKDVQHAQSAPHASDHETRYPGTCRPREKSIPVTPPTDPEQPLAWRVIVPDEPITFTDQFQGPRSFDVQQQVGDFLVATKAGLPSYQLAVVVDDARQGVTDVVRGDDLLPSTARQLWLHQMLNLTPPDRYTHLPLVLGPDGKRLAKRHGDSRLAYYRQQGVPPQRVIGLIAYWSGLTDHRQAMAAGDFQAGFSLAKLPHTPATFTPEDHAWLLQR